MKPIAIDLFCGLGGWTEGLLAAGYRVIGFDIERHQYGDQAYPAQLVIQDVLTIHGSQFRNADLIVASPPCQEYSYMAMPWTRAKQIAKGLRGEGDFPEGYKGSRTKAELTALFDACFRIQREASAAAGRHVPMVVENVRGAIPWVGRARTHYGSFYLWGDVPALMPVVQKAQKGRSNFHFFEKTGLPSPSFHGAAHEPSVVRHEAIKNNGGSWCAREDGAKTPPGNCSEPMWKDRPIARLAHATPEEMERHGFKVPGFRFDGSGKSFQTASVEGLKHGGDWFSDPDSPSRQGGITKQREHDAVREGTKQAGIGGPRENGKGDAWFQDGAARHGSKSNARKAASAQIAKIPLTLSRHIADYYWPTEQERIA